MPDLENTNPEVQTSPESKLVQQLTELVGGALDAYKVEPVMSEDGTRRRELEASDGSDLIEISGPDGIKSYGYTGLFHMDTDRGGEEWKWIEGSNAIEFTRNSEVEGITTRTINDQDGINSVISDVKYVISKLPQPEQPTEPPIKQKRRWRFLGRKALKS